MNKRSLFSLLIATTLTGLYSWAQPICLGTDATVCVGSSVTIQDCNPGNQANGLLLNSPTYITLSDDSWSGVVPIGFTFNFYGVNYTQCVIGSNGLVSFNLGNANGYCPWSLAGVMPLPTNTLTSAYNTMMPAYHDINPSSYASPNGEIMYKTVGTAPNRKFIVLWKDIMAFGGGGECTYMALIMNETANSFEFHVGYKPIALGWNNGLAIQGSENNAGTVAHITPGRNVSQWSATQEAKVWTPTAPNNTANYTISNIPYTMVMSPSSTYQWESTTGQNWPYNSGTLTVNPVQSGTTGYFLVLAAQSCANNVGAASDTTWITGVSSAVSASSTPDICSSGIGTVTANPTAGVPPYSFNWPALGSTNQTVNGVYTGTYTVQMVDGMGCASSANVFVGDTPATFSGTTTVVSCPGGNDGTATANMNPPLGTISYQWNDPASQTTQTATGLTAGNYTCYVTSTVGCTGTVNVTVTEIPGMIGNIAFQSDATCNSGNDGVITVNVVQGTAPYAYAWDNSTSTSNTASDLYAGTHICTITDANGCQITVTGTIGEPAPLNITFITPNTQLCPEDTLSITANGSGGSSAYTFTWFENGALIGQGQTITVDPEVTNTTYCVTLSEACGSPTDQECTLLYFPTPIEPSAYPDEVEKCVPGFFEFTNSSTNASEIATTYWDFGSNNHIALENGADSISMLFPNFGTYTLTMTVTSIYGCVYVDSVPNIIEVKPMPTADFFFSTNPATIFETTVFMQDKSTPDVVSWQWYSPYSNPSQSNSVNPVFVFPDGEVGEYPVTLIVETERGCIDTTTLIFHVVEDILFYAPNTFTPDGDEFNQEWRPFITGIDIYDFDLFIFDRWGELIWESHDPEVGWDGTYKGEVLPAGVYVWRSTVKSPRNDGKLEFSGSINLLK